ncbi:MAG: prenyltransferase/squalene oxidase repeat-containing protein [Acidimicrobiales bacterium]
MGSTITVSAAPAPRSGSAAQPTAAQAGATWIAHQFTGKDIVTSGSPDPSSTVQAVLAFAAAGVGGAKAKAAVAWLKKNFESYVSSGGVDDAGALAYVILAAQAVGADPTQFGGKKPADDLITRLEGDQQTSGADAGLFGSTDPTYDGAFRQGLSLMALANQGVSSTSAVMEAGITWLQEQQCSDGGWESYRSVSTACAAPDPDSFTGPDTNSTSSAVEGLVAAGASFPVNPLGFFESAQNTDGGFGFIGASSQSPDPDSTAEVIQALVAIKELTNPAFTQGTATPASALATYQQGCSAAAGDRGSYTFPGEDGPNLLATLQAVPGAAEVAFPLKSATMTRSLPKVKCPKA